jgi:opacity protein-like surface antigen
MKKILLGIISMLFLALPVFAEEEAGNNKESMITPYISAANESEISISSVEDEEDENYNNENSDNSYFNGFDNNTSLDAGILFTVNDVLSILIFLGARDVNWTIDNNGVFGYSSSQLYAGLGLDITPADFMGINLKISNFEIFESGNRVKAGMDFETNFTFTFEKAFLDFSICNNFKPAFNRYQADINDVIGYNLTFNFFNFINDKINIGIYIEGEFDSLNTIESLSTKTYSFANEFFAGITASPVEFMSVYVLFAMFNEGQIEDNAFIEGSKINSYGLKTGISFQIKWFSVEAYYVPKIRVYIDDEKKAPEHIIGLNAGFEF